LFKKKPLKRGYRRTRARNRASSSVKLVTQNAGFSPKGNLRGTFMFFGELLLSGKERGKTAILSETGASPSARFWGGTRLILNEITINRRYWLSHRGGIGKGPPTPQLVGV